jgi:hypothetical protein
LTQTVLTGFGISFYAALDADIGFEARAYKNGRLQQCELQDNYFVPAKG